MQTTPICLSCATPDMEDRVCSAYPSGIPFRILHGAGCDFFLLDPAAPPPVGDPSKPKTPVKDPF